MERRREISTSNDELNPIRESRSAVQISRILEILYLPAGLFAFEAIESYSSVYLAILYSLFACNVIGVAATITDPNAQPLENLYFVSSGFIVLVSLLIGRHHKDYLWNLYGQVVEYQKSAEFNRLCDTLIRGKLKYAAAAILVPLIFIVVVPVYTMIRTDAKTDDFTVLLYPMWYPWKRDTTRKYLCSLFLQYASVLYGYYLMSFLMGSLVFASLFVRVRFVILARKISRMRLRLRLRLRLPTRSSSVQRDTTATAAVSLFDDDDDADDDDDDDLNENFARIVREHQTLISFTKRTISCFTLIATILVTYATTTAAFLITLFLKSDLSRLLKMKLFSTSVVGMISLVVCCLCGDVLLRLNRLLLDSIYNTPWYTFPIGLRKCVVIFMIQNQREFQMKSFGLSLLCKSYIGTVCKLLYSCIQFLRQRAA